MLGSILAIIIATEPASSATAAAELHAERASALWAERDLEGAQRELAAAYALDPIPKYLYGLGSIAKDRGDCPLAVDYFERFLRELPDAEIADESKRGEIESDAVQQIEACGGSHRAEERALRSEPPPPATRPSVDEPRSGARPWHRDPVGGTLLGVGSVAVATGVGLLVSAAVIDHRLPQSDSATEFVASRGRARAVGIAGIATISVGAALVLGAAIRYVVVRRSSRRGPLALRF